MMQRQPAAAAARSAARAFLAVAALAIVTPGAPSQTAEAQRPSETFYACYSPPSGVVYRIRESGVPQKCVDPDDVQFSWTSGGSAGGPPGDAGGQSQGGGAPTVPTGAVAFFEAASCPSGWSVFEAAQGRAIVGLGEGGTLGGTVGAQLSDLEDRGHSHTLAAVELTSSSAGAHSHTMPAQTLVTSGDGMHNHVWARKTSGSGSGANLAWYDGRGTQLINWGDGVGNEGSGHYPISTSEWGSISLYTSMAGLHSHRVDIASLTSAESGAHEHTASLAERATSNATTSDVIPYVQLLACRKS